MAYGMAAQPDPTNVMGKRVVAYIIDVLLTSGVLIAVLALTKTNAYTGAPKDACQALRDTSEFSGLCLQFGSRVYTWEGGRAGVAYLIAAVVSFANLVVLQGVTGASIGKMILGLRVVNAQGAPCGVGRAFLRWIFLVIDSICGVVGLIIASVTHPHRRVGDMVANTFVVGLGSVGQPMPGTVPAPQYQYGYGQPGTSEWAPPGQAPPSPAPGWGATPPPAWGAPPPATQPASGAWGAPPAAATTPPPAPPAWGEPPPPPPAWGAPPPPSPPPAPAPPPATAAPSPDRSGWGTAPSTWGAPEPAPEPAPAPTPPPPPPPAPPADQPGWGAPAEPTPPPPPAPPEAAPEAAPEPEGESWWNKAFGDDDEPKQ